MHTHNVMTPEIRLHTSCLSISYVRENGYVEKILAAYREQHVHIDTLQINGDWIDSLVVPDGIETLIACELGLKSITIPKSVSLMYLDDNCLTELRLPRDSSAIVVTAKNNYIEHLICEDGQFPKKLMDLKLKSNRLREIMYPRHDALGTVDVRFQNGFITLDKIHPSLLNNDDEYTFRSCQFSGNEETIREAV
jgi:hypothetical protein